METMTKPKLNIGGQYPVQLYPEETKVNAKYLGLSDKEHIFSFEFGGEEMYALLEDKRMCKKEDGTISYANTNWPIWFFNSATLETISAEEKSRLLKMLNSVGVKL
jgi:hypothetical protein